ncbi:chloramphenicol phosphotransferase CPT family protein [Bacillus sp. PS06]|uniref:chloramphenicol phosphotransferase CPT family protein n=1 Tax=Bacillus sp. PS06 TaxID=2764176 RepID=UPI00177BB7FA|nr:chloramphenicol phosphotransferase [Bacillus sp. PS06]MBD8069785.1 chloramphenicol phosphotransferase [Bacillus sp. PS06]
MLKVDKPAKVIILNGTPRSGKSSIASVIQKTFDGVWMNVGVDQFMQMTPEKYQPGMGLRPGGERPDLEPLIKIMYQSMFEATAQFSRLGLNVVMDVGLHDGYSVPLRILPDCIHILDGLPVWFVGVRCPLEIVMERRINTWNVGYNIDGKVPEPVALWQQLVHVPGIYDIEVDTSILSPEECSRLIQQRLEEPPTAFQIIRNSET